MADDEIDPTLHGLMSEAFGPPEADGDGGDRVERGLSAVEELSRPEAAAVRWLHEARWPVEGLPELAERVCFACGAAAPKSNCASCGVAAYCGRDCQKADWGRRGAFGGHKSLCDGYRALGRAQALEPGAPSRAAVEALLASIRLYLCPFAVCHGPSGVAEGAPAGFAFVQSPCTLAQLALPAPRDCAGRPLDEPRAVFLHFVTLAEFDTELATRDARFAELRPALAEAVGAQDERLEVVVLCKTGCGFAGVVVAPLVPAFPVCRQLAAEYEGREALQLNIDDK